MLVSVARSSVDRDAIVLPVHLGELQCRALGAKVEAFDPQGRPLIDEVGELVLTEPMPSMPLGLWGDTDGSRLHESYFDTYPGVWRHGDWIRITPGGSAVIYGRSDATINRGGIRMGTAEIYLKFALGRPDAFAAADLALAEAAKLLYDLSERPGPSALIALAEPWRPWRAVAARGMWAYYRVAKGREGVR